MRIVIDLQGAQTESRYRGIGRYSLSLAQGIARHRGEHEVFIALNGLFAETIGPLRRAFDGILPPGNVFVWYAPQLVRAIHRGNEKRRKAAERLREAFLARLQPDILLTTSLFEGYADDAVTGMGENVIPGCCTVAVLYDLIPYLSPREYLAPNPAFEQFYTDKIALLQRCSGCLAISRSSAKEGMEALNLPEERVGIISTACDPVFRKQTLSSEDAEAFLARLGIRSSFVLYTGGVDQRKNLPRLLKAYAFLPQDIREKHQLVFAGKIPPGNLMELRHQAISAGLGELELLCTGYVSEEDLVTLYNLCALFVLPSLHEGFGLPALEAMNCGAPVLGSNTSSIPEVIGMEEALFDPWDEKEMAAAMRKGLTDAAFRETLRANAAVRRKLFSWDVTARRAVTFMENLRKKEGDNPPLPENPETVAREIASFWEEEVPESDLRQTAWALCLNFPEARQKSLFVDVSELCQRDAGSGVQRVTRSILKELLAHPPKEFAVYPVYATLDSTGYRYARRFTAAFRGQSPSELKDDPLDMQAGDFFLGLDLQHHVVLRQKAYLEALSRAGVTVAFVVYDLLPVVLPHCFLPGTKEGHEAWLRTVCGFDGAFCISRSVAQELERWLAKELPEKADSFGVRWFHLGADVENVLSSTGMPRNAAEILASLSSAPVFLMVGTMEPRKGYAQVLEAFDLLWQRGVEAHLVMVGKPGWMTEALAQRINQHPQQGKRLFWFQKASDEFLEKLYGVSTALVAASKGEGFGLPLIEAARHGLPLILRDIPVFREVAGEHAWYFSGSRGEELAQSLEQWLALYRERRHPSSHGLSWLTWSQSAEGLVKEVLSLRHGQKEELSRGGVL